MEIKDQKDLFYAKKDQNKIHKTEKENRNGDKGSE